MLNRVLTIVIPVLLTTVCAAQSPNIAEDGMMDQSAREPVLSALPDGVSIHQLDNGLQVLLIENPALPMIGVNVVVKVGSAYETFASSGMSHMLEHLLFNGTATRTQQQLYDDVDRIGGYNNANTSEFYTNYMMVTPTDHIRTGMEIQADMLFHSILPLEKFEKEKGIVLEEIARNLANSNAQLERNIASVLYAGHALSLPTVGTYATIQSMSRDAVSTFYKNHYVPNNMILSAIGSFRADSMLAMIKEIYGTASPANVERPENSQWLTGLARPERASAQPGAVYHRFYNGTRPKLQLFYPIPADATDALLSLLQIVVDKQLDSLQTAIQAEIPEQVQSMQFATRASVLGNHLQVTVNLRHTRNLQALIHSVHRRVLGLDLSLPSAQVQKQAVKAQTDFLKNSEKPHMFGIYNAETFALGGIEAVLASYSGQRYFAAAEKLADLQLRDDPVVIVQHMSGSKTSDQGIPELQRKLFAGDSSSPTLIAIQNPGSNLLAIHFLLKNKAFYESKFGKEAAKVLHECFLQRLTSDENLQLSSRFGFSFKFNDNVYLPMDNIYLHPDFGYLRVEGLAADLPGAVKFLVENLSGFAPTVAEFEQARKKFQRLGHMRGADSAKRRFEETYREIIYEGDKYPAGDSLTYDSLTGFARAYFHPANMIISAVSPATPDTMAALFTGFRSTEKPAAETSAGAWDRGLLKQDEPVQIDKPGSGEQAHLFWGFVQDVDPLDKPALKALSLILSDRIVFEIREKQGMAYRMSAGVELKQDKALFYIRVATRPRNVDVLLPQFSALLSADALGDLTRDDVEKAVNKYLGRMMFRRLSSINQAYYLGHSYYFHGDMNYDRRFLDRLSEVERAEVMRVARKYMHIVNPVSIVIR